MYSVDERAILYYHLRSGEVFKTHRSEKDFDYLKRLLDAFAEGVSNDGFVPFYGFHCNMCDLRSICERYAIQHHGGPKIVNLEGKIKGAERFSDWDAPTEDWIEMQTEERS
jgi:hypothetical protein